MTSALSAAHTEQRHLRAFIPLQGVMGMWILGNSHQVYGRQRRVRHQHTPVCQNILRNLGFKEGKQAPLCSRKASEQVHTTVQ